MRAYLHWARPDLKQAAERLEQGGLQQAVRWKGCQPQSCQWIQILRSCPRHLSCFPHLMKTLLLPLCRQLQPQQGSQLPLVGCQLPQQRPACIQSVSADRRRS